MNHPPRRVVIVGGGLSGHTAATTLRESGFDGDLTLVTREARPPYDRPPLSKEFLVGAVTDTRLDRDLAELEVRVELGATATELRPTEVCTSVGRLPFDAAIVAPGLSPRSLPGQAASPRAHVLRTHEDALRLRESLTPGRRVVVVGAGLIGAEVGTAAARLGCQVSVVSPVLMSGLTALPDSLLDDIAGWYAECGIALTIGVPVAGITPDGIRLAGGEELPADVVVVAIGGAPDTAWLAGSGMVRDDRGRLVVDESLGTSLPSVYGAGDVITWPSARYGERVSLEHWQHAAESGRAAAESALGADTRYDPLPYFWSHQLNHTLHYIGRHRPEDAVEFHPESSRGSSVTWSRAGRTTAVLAVDAPQVVRRARRGLLEPVREPAG